MTVGEITKSATEQLNCLINLREIYLMILKCTRWEVTGVDFQRVEIKDFDAEGKEHSNQPSNKSSSQHSHPEPGMFLILILYVVCL